MATVRNFISAFSVAAVVLMALISLVLMGCTLMNEFVTVADLGYQLIAAAIMAVILAVPLAAVGASSRQFDFLSLPAA